MRINQSNMARSGVGPLMMFALYAIYFIVPDQGYISGALANIALACDVDPGIVTYLSTLPALTQIVTGLITGYLVGRRIKYKTLLIIATAGMTVMGMIPGFLPVTTPFWFILATRVVFGLFLGCLMPSVNATVASLFRNDENKRASILGRGNAVFNIGAIFGLVGGGVLASFAWNGAFWLYAIGVVVLVLIVFFYKEPPYEEAEKAQKIKIPLISWFFVIAFMIVNTVDNSVFIILSEVLTKNGIGDSSVSGALIAVFTVAGVVVSLLFGSVFKLFKNQTMCIMAVIAAIGSLGTFFFSASSATLIPLVIFLFIYGFGHSALNVGTSHFASLFCSPATFAAAMGTAFALWNVGSFLSSPFIQVIGLAANGDYRYTFVVASVVLVAMAIAYGVVIARNNRKLSSNSAVSARHLSV